MEERIFLEELTTNKVNVLKKKYIVINGVEYQVGEPCRCSYENSVLGRSLILENLTDPYYSAVMVLWGESPTVTLD